MMSCRSFCLVVDALLVSTSTGAGSELPTPLAYWKLDDGKDGNAAEANDGSPLPVSESGEIAQDDRRGGVFHFQQGEGIPLPDAVLGKLTDTLTVSMWLKPNWFHLAVTFGEWVQVHVDGKLIGSRIVDPSAMSPGASPYPASMRFMENETGGPLDEVRIFNRVLSENEIRALAAP